jgi:hypothetical protein
VKSQLAANSCKLGGSAMFFYNNFFCFFNFNTFPSSDKNGQCSAFGSSFDFTEKQTQ